MSKKQWTLTDNDQAFLQTYDIKRFERPSITADNVVFSMAFEERSSYRQEAQGRLEVLLTQRSEPPFQGVWALPGGFLLPDETLESCASRKLLAKTGVKPGLLIPAGVYSDPQRDPRGWIISRAFMSILPERLRTELADGAQWFRVDTEQQTGGDLMLTLMADKTQLHMTMRRADNGYGQPGWEVVGDSPLAFDHAQILMTALSDLRWGAGAFRYIFDFLPEEFSLSALQNVQETITGKPTGAANFRRKVAGYVEETGMSASGAGHRPAMLYRKKTETEEQV